MLARDKYTVFDRKARKYRKGVHRKFLYIHIYAYYNMFIRACSLGCLHRGGFFFRTWGGLCLLTYMGLKGYRNGRACRSA